MVEADLLILLSHVEGFYDGPPNKSGSALIPVIKKIDGKIYDLVFDGASERTTGGMTTKLIAARYCLSMGIPLFITSGLQKNFIKQVFTDKLSGTFFVPTKKSLGARKNWIANVRSSKGSLTVDSGAQKALLEGKKSLLPSGIASVKGSFEQGDCIQIVSKTGKLLGKGLSNYSCKEVEQIMGRKSSDIQKILGYKYGDEVIHRDDLVVE